MIPNGTLVWKDEDAEGDYLNNYEELEAYIQEKSMNEEDIKHLIIHACGWKGKLFNITDDSKYMNHSHESNLSLEYFALQDI